MERGAGSNSRGSTKWQINRNRISGVGEICLHKRWMESSILVNFENMNSRCWPITKRPDSADLWKKLSPQWRKLSDSVIRVAPPLFNLLSQICVARKNNSLKTVMRNTVPAIVRINSVTLLVTELHEWTMVNKTPRESKQSNAEKIEEGASQARLWSLCSDITYIEQIKLWAQISLLKDRFRNVEEVLTIQSIKCLEVILLWRGAVNNYII